MRFWHRFVLPHLTAIMDGRGATVWRDHIRDQLDEHARALFPLVAREYLGKHGGERLASAARETGGLWGLDYDIEPAGTLHTGAAVYGRTSWGGKPVSEAADDALQEEVRRTRYGFGKESRIRVLFSSEGFTTGLLRRAARSDALHLLSLGELQRS